MMQPKHPGKSITFLFLLSMTSLLLGQSAWNTGSLNLDYQTFPLPSETLDLSGDLISNEVPHEGIGGFELSMGDTNLITLLAYDLHVTDGDTLADIFVIFMKDTLPMGTGNYMVNPSPDALKLFVWLHEVDAESLTGLINASFTLDSLAAFNPYISVSGEMEIVSSSIFHFEMNFSGVMVNTSIQLRTISNGHFDLWNTLPVSAYTQGSVDYTVGSESGIINGALNPLTEPEGAGAILTQANDTLTYNFISYIELPDSLYDVYGVILMGDESDFPSNGSESIFNISLTDDVLPKAVPYMMRAVSVDEILLLLESGATPDLDQLSQLYLPVGPGSAAFSYTPEDNAVLAIDNVIMTNSAADITSLGTDWLLTNRLSAVSGDENTFHPSSNNIAGNAYPNPFNSSTLIPIQLSSGCIISAHIYNLRGQEVQQIELGYRGQGQHQLTFDFRNSNLAGGLYYYTLNSTLSLIGSGSFVYLK